MATVLTGVPGATSAVAAVPAVPAESALWREKLAQEFSFAWNQAGTLGEFFEKNVDPRVPITERKRFRALTEVYRWVPLPKALPIKNTILFQSESGHTAAVWEIKTVAPLTIERGSRRVSVANRTEITKILQRMEEDLPTLWKGRAKVRTSWLDVLLPSAQALEGQAESLGGSAIEVGLLAYGGYGGVKKSGRSQGQGGAYYGINRTNDRDPIARLIDEDRRAMEADVVTNRAKFQRELTRWAAGNLVSGTCGGENSFAPRLVTKATPGLVSLEYRQKVEGGVHRLQIAKPGSRETFAIDRPFTRNSDVTDRHRVFADGDRVYRQCEGEKCTVLKSEEFDRLVHKFAASEENAKARVAFDADRKQAKELFDRLRKDYREYYERQNMNEQGPKVENRRLKEANAADSKREEIRASVAAEIERMKAETNWIFRSKYPELEEVNGFLKFATEILGEGTVDKEKNPGLRALQDRLRENGTVREYKRWGEAADAAWRSAEKGFANRPVRAREMKAIVDSFEFCRIYGMQCLSLQRRAESGDVEGFYLALERDADMHQLSRSLERRHLSKFENEGRELRDRTLASDAFASCCDDKECAATMEAQLKIRARAGDDNSQLPTPATGAESAH